MRMGRKRLLAGALTALLLTGLLPARAAQTQTLLPEEAQGYLFAVKADAPMLLQVEGEGIETVSARHGIYKAETLEDVDNFAPADCLEYVIPDYVMQQHDAIDFLPEELSTDYSIGQHAASINDPAYENGWAWHLDMLDMSYAWDNGITGAGVRVGIVDSGVRRSHEDLDKTRVLPGTYYPAGTAASQPGTEETGGPTDPTNAHGSFVAGMISAIPGNDKGTAGVSPGVELIPLVSFSGSTTYLSAVLKGIYGGVDDYKCDILNLSLGIYKDKPLSDGSYPNIQPLQEAVEYAWDQGVLMVSSVGNSAGELLSYPAAYPQVIGVGSVDKNGVQSYFSQYNSSVHVMAPGETVCSLSYSDDAKYVQSSGTSYAAPQVAAVAALALEIDPELTAREIMDLMAQTSVDKGTTGWDNQYGYGILNAAALLERVAAPQVETEAAPGGLTLSARYCRQTPGQTATVLAAAYDGEGRMVDWDRAETAADENGILLATGLTLDTTEGASVVRVFLWDADGLPLAEEISITVE